MYRFLVRVMMLNGQFPPIPTPFLDGSFSARALTDNLARWNDLPLAGYVVLGSNGEAPLLDEDERAAVIRTVRAATPPGRKMIVGVGRESTRATIRTAKEAFDLGADAVLVGVPTYYKPAMTQEVLCEHFQQVAQASQGPVVLYSVPFFTGIPLAPSLFEEMLRFDNVIGIKDSSGDMPSLEGMLAAASRQSREVSVLVGNARLLADGLQRGASGAVLAVANLAAVVCDEIGRLVTAGDIARARQLNESILPLTSAVTREYGIGGLKAALDLLHYHGGDPRPPLPAATALARAGIAAHLSRLGLLT